MSAAVHVHVADDAFALGGTASKTLNLIDVEQQLAAATVRFRATVDDEEGAPAFAEFLRLSKIMLFTEPQDDDEALAKLRHVVEEFPGGTRTDRGDIIALRQVLDFIEQVRRPPEARIVRILHCVIEEPDGRRYVYRQE
jgi:hypothetical protein